MAVTCLRQVRVLAVDEGVPARTATTTVQVNVARDRSVLTFSSENYSAETSENRDVDSVIFRVQASPGVTNSKLIAKFQYKDNTWHGCRLACIRLATVMNVPMVGCRSTTTTTPKR